MSIDLAASWRSVDGAGRSVRTVSARLAGRCFVAGLIGRPAGWHGHAHLHVRQAPVSIDLAAPWRPVDGAGRSVRT